MLRTGFIGVLSAAAACAAFSCSSSESTTPAEPSAGAAGSTAAGGSGGSGGVVTGGSGGVVTGGSGGVVTGGSGGVVTGGSGGVVTGGSGGVATGGAGGASGGAGGAATGGAGGSITDAGPNGTTSDGATKPGAFDGGAPRIFPPTVPVSAPTPIGAQTNPRTITFENHCTYTIWMFGSPVADKALVPVKIDSGQALVTTWPDLTGGRLWGRTNCVKNGTNWACDQTGNDTLVEFTLTRGEQSDWYNLSMVDGYTLPVALLQMSAPFTIPATYKTGMRLDTSGVQQCGSPVCAAELLANCPADHRITNNGKTVGCKNGESTNNGAGPTDLTLYLKNGCPTTYTFPYDDPWSLFKCKTLSQGQGKAKDYKIVWCPTEGPVPGFPQYPLQ
jgi:hypothetical protein